MIKGRGGARRVPQALAVVGNGFVRLAALARSSPRENQALA